MKKISRFNNTINLTDSLTAIYNSREDQCVIVKKELSDLLPENLPVIEQNHPSVYQDLINIKAIIEDTDDELAEIIERSRQIDNAKDHYRLIINPTMNCNFKCWYCYESHVEGSKISDGNIERICKFIDNVLNDQKELQTFELSFFGGEPLMYYSKVTRPIIDHFRSKYSDYPNVVFSISFTSNGYLLSDKILNHLLEGNEGKFFQITLDGSRDVHNNVRVAKKEGGSYDKIIDSIQKLLAVGVEVMLRINYTADTISSVKEIAPDLSHFKQEELTNFTVSFHRVWQDKDNNDEVVSELMIAKKAFSDAGLIPKAEGDELFNNFSYPCYADKSNEVVINYNGDIYKCTARDFSDENKYGHLNDNGELVWNDKLITWETLKIQSKACQNCRILPLCGGGCHQINLEALGMDICQMGYSPEDKDDIIIERLDQLFFNEKEEVH